MAPLPGRCKKAAGGRSEDVGKGALPALDGVPGLSDTEAGHLVTALRKPGDGPPAARAMMEVAVQEQLPGRVLHQAAVVAMRHQRPCAMPVGHDGTRETPSDERRQVADYLACLAGVRRRGVVKAEQEAAHQLTG